MWLTIDVMSSKDWKRGLRRLAPGVYDDGKGAMHLDLAEMCEANGYLPTEENQETLLRAWMETHRELVIETLTPPVDHKN